MGAAAKAAAAAAAKTAVRTMMFLRPAGGEGEDEVRRNPGSLSLDASLHSGALYFGSGR